MATKHRFAEVWLIIYAWALILLPPLQWGSKNFFAAEILLLPLVLLFLTELFLGRVHRPPLELIFTWCALFICFVAGMHRGDLASGFSLYPLNDDSFHWGRDLTRLTRWALIFSTPYLVREAFFDEKDKILSQIFIKAIKSAVIISSVVALLQYLKVLDLSKLYGYEIGLEWKNRSFGTFASPLEASLVYGAVFIHTLSDLMREKRQNFTFNVSVATLSGMALLTTHGGTGILCTALCAVVLALRPLKSSQRQRSLSLLGGGVVIGILLVAFAPPGLIQQKINNFSIRINTWAQWTKLLPQHPMMGITGIGFTGTVADNSFFLLLILGGVILLVSTLNWITRLVRAVPSSFALFFLFWIFSWLSLDSIGYWGIGRMAWLLLGLF